MVMLTGDNQKVADAVAKEIGLTDAWGSLLPEEKVDAIKPELISLSDKIWSNPEYNFHEYKASREFADLLKHFGFDKYTNILYGADHNNKLKKVDIIEKCMVDLGVTDYSNAVMIGDSSHDAIGAEKIGMDFIGVTYGFDFRTPEDVYKFKAVGAAAMPLDLLNLI